MENKQCGVCNLKTNLYITKKLQYNNNIKYKWICKECYITKTENVIEEDVYYSNCKKCYTINNLYENNNGNPICGRCLLLEELNILQIN